MGLLQAIQSPVGFSFGFFNKVYQMEVKQVAHILWGACYDSCPNSITSWNKPLLIEVWIPHNHVNMIHGSMVTDRTYSTALKPQYIFFSFFFFSLCFSQPLSELTALCELNFYEVKWFKIFVIPVLPSTRCGVWHLLPLRFYSPETAQIFMLEINFFGIRLPYMYLILFTVKRF